MSSESTLPESERVAALRGAEQTALALFEAVLDRGLVVPGVTERELSDQVRTVAAESFGITRY